MSKETLKNTPEQEKSIEYAGGSIDYSVIGDTDNPNPILIIPGFTEGRFVMRNFASELSQVGHRKVIFPDQPVPDKNRKSKMSIIDQHASALLEIIKSEGLSDRPLDIIAHSFGSLVAVRLAEMAKDQGLTCFESEQGSHSLFISPAGSNDKENLVRLGGRWLKFVKREANPTPVFSHLTRTLDPTGEMLKAGQKNAKANLAKTLEEIIALSKKEKIYGDLGRLGLKPHIFGYANDTLYPHKVIKAVMEANGKVLHGYSVPIDNGGVGASNFEEFRQKSGLSGKQAKAAWAHHYRNAGHNDWLFHPERTVKAVLQIFDQ